MIIRKYGIILRRLTEKDIELVRVHRNSSDIQSHMFYQENITVEMQRKWFDSINNIYNHYFIIEHNDNEIGMIYGKNDNYVERSTESGIFIWDKNYLNSFEPAMASIILTDLTFGFRELKKIYATVKKSNKKVISYIEDLGYDLLHEIPVENKLVYILEEDNYLSKAVKIKKAIAQISKDASAISTKDIDFSKVSAEERKKLYQGYPPYLQEKFDALFKH